MADGKIVWNDRDNHPLHHRVTPKPSVDEMAHVIEEWMARAPKNPR